MGLSGFGNGWNRGQRLRAALQHRAGAERGTGRGGVPSAGQARGVTRAARRLAQGGLPEVLQGLAVETELLRKRLFHTTPPFGRNSTRSAVGWRLRPAETPWRRWLRGGPW